ncbi:MAG: hypothetical protein ISR99_00400 [Parcubacteria group bacterium]|nr:hypothetical protein [Parcubacteria group bacterium]
MRFALKKEVLALIFLLAILVFLIPVAPAEAIIPFGGRVLAFSPSPCLNGVIYTVIGPPVGGVHIWAPTTWTFLYGPPSHIGQAALGLSLPPDICILNYVPFIAISGLRMILLGTSA